MVDCYYNWRSLNWLRRLLNLVDLLLGLCDLDDLPSPSVSHQLDGPHDHEDPVHDGPYPTDEDECQKQLQNTNEQERLDVWVDLAVRNHQTHAREEDVDDPEQN